MTASDMLKDKDVINDFLNNASSNNVGTLNGSNNTTSTNVGQLNSLMQVIVERFKTKSSHSLKDSRLFTQLTENRSNKCCSRVISYYFKWWKVSW